MRTLCILVTILIFNLEIFSSVITAGIIFGLTALSYGFCIFYPTYYSKSASKFFLMQNFITFWFSSWVFLVLLAGGVLAGSFTYFLCCIPLVLAIFYFKNPIDDEKIVLQQFEEIETAKELEIKLEGMRYYLNTRYQYRTSDIMSEKILAASHAQFSLEEQFNLFVATKAKNGDKYESIENRAVISLINTLYVKGLKKFNNSFDLSLSYACFLIEVEKSENVALEKAIMLETSTESFNKLYVIQTLKDYVMQTQLTKKDDMYSDSIRFEQLVNKRLEDKLNQLMFKATQCVFELYQMLDEEGLLMKRIELQLSRVAKNQKKLESLWISNYSILSKNAEATDKMIFLFKYIYDKEKIGDIRINSMNDSKKRDLKSDKLRFFNIDQSMSIFSDPTILIRLTENDLLIEDLNLAVLRLLGYMRKDLIGRSS